MAKRNNEEIFQIHAWVAEWLGTSEKECKFTWEDIREICRGPMREVLLDFVLQRFRPEGQIQVIRDNLYLNTPVTKNSHKDPRDAGSQLDREIEDLKKKVAQVKEEKTKVLKNISVHQDTLNKKMIDMQQSLMEKVTFSDDFHSHAKFVKSRVTSTNTLLESLINTKGTKSGEGTSASSPTSGDNPALDSVSSNNALLNSLYNDTVELFNIYFLQDANSTPAGQSEMQALETTISSKTMELRQRGLSQYCIESWASGEQEKSATQLRTAANKLADVMSPIAELTSEAETLHINFMKALVEIHFQNRKATQAEEALKSQNSQNVENMVVNEACALPTDLLACLEKERLLAEFKKCKELKLEMEDRNTKHQGADEHLLKLIGDKDRSASSQQTEKSYNEQNGNTAGESSGFTNVSTETLEDLTCALFRSFPQSARKLESTVHGCRNLVFNEFPAAFEATAKCKPKVALGSSGIQDHINGGVWDDVPVQIPKELVVNADLVFKEMKTDIDVQELLNLKQELEKKQAQSKVVTDEFKKRMEDH
ncbi:hypothetical protein Ocin01_10955 [Orchesella cincta]|uniref:Uncharacterized protein n=1 Tax=Orchesella cincta TaxID=48709 RepID=A0A1D2MS21_ORCCI|nr:hypothetical protein Ocin01_10955 [Orchesella cincta]